MQVSKRLIVAVLVGALAGILWLVAIRFIVYSPETIHYHANFGLFVNGEREQFDSFGFYEEVTACGEGDEDPARRVHMHDNINDVVHVHDKEVTWIQFFENIRFGLGNTYVQTDDGLFFNEDGKKVSFILNGESIRNIQGRIIGDEDVLLISYGDESNDGLTDQYNQIVHSAGEFNEKADPAACSGDDNPSFIDRLRHAIFL